jgi:hypothetical protein
MSRDDIIRAIGEATRDVDLSRFDPRRSEPANEPTRLDRAKARIATVDLSRIDLSKVDLSRVDVPKAIAAAGQAAGLVRRSRRPRLPLIIGGLVTIGLIGYAVATSPMVRPRIDAAARRARARLDAMREAAEADESIIEAPDVETVETAPAVAESFEVAEAVAVPIEPTAFLAEAPDLATGEPSVASEPLNEASRD